MFHRILSAAGVAAASYLIYQAVAFAGPTTKINKHNTTSGSGVILSGEKSTTVQLSLPSCPVGEALLITGVVAAPIVTVGNTSNDVVNLGRWAVSVATYQNVAGGSGQVPLVLHGNGPETLSLALPAGQDSGAAGSSNFPVSVNLLPFSAANNFRHQFAVHVTTACGNAFVAN